MRGYASSGLRILLLAGLCVAALFLIARPVVAQNAPQQNNVAQNVPAQTIAAPEAPSTASGGGNTAGITSTFGLIMENRDPVFFTIIALSIWGVTLIIQGFLVNRSAVVMPRRTIETIREMILQRRFKDLLDFTETDPSFISRSLNPALKRAPIFSSMKEAMETAIGEQTAEQFRRIEYLNIIGNLGPLLGLLGTVLGMIDAFLTLNNAGGEARPAQLAYGISKALVHTMLGLTLAVPCLAAFGILRTIVDRLTIRAALVCEDLLLMIKPADPRQVGGAPVAAAAPGAAAVPTPVPQPMR